MTSAVLVWGQPYWWLPLTILVLGGLGVLWSYWRAPAGRGTRIAAACLKIIALVIVAMCLMEPLIRAVRPKPGANLVAVVADNSRSLTIRDAELGEQRADLMKKALDDDAPWLRRLAQDFDVRRYVFDEQLQAVDTFASMEFSGTRSALANALSAVSRRLSTRPTAGVVLVTDGIATDWDASLPDIRSLPPVYPVVVGGKRPGRDIGIQSTVVSQTNFETAPVTLAVEITAHGVDDQDVVVQLLDDRGEEKQRQTVQHMSADRPFVARFQFRPEKPGISLYRVRVMQPGDEDGWNEGTSQREATLVNNQQWAVVQRRRGPYRVLYVSGRPNWELKFLRRAIQGDEEVQLISLVRIARKEPKFVFRGHLEERSNPLFRGFDPPDPEETQQYDQPVLLLIPSDDAPELREGFPKTEDGLFAFDAVILDDVEASFFSRDQMTLLHEFVSRRGGGLLVLGGEENFRRKDLAHTPVGELLPIYLSSEGDSIDDRDYRLLLTRDGWLRSWVRLRKTRDEDQQRLSQMCAFQVLNGASGLKPGAEVLAEVRGASGQTYPALVTHRFGSGRSAALLIGDFWRWQLRREEDQPKGDLEKAWRQMVRWLVSDVPRRVEVTATQLDDPGRPWQLDVLVRDETYRPLDNATVSVEITLPDQKTVTLTADPAEDQLGVYRTQFVSRLAGPYLARITARGPDGQTVGTSETGWAENPSLDEFKTTLPNRSLLEQLASATGGEVIEVDELENFVRSLPNRKIPVTEPWIYPWWHQWPVFALALLCLIGEWTLRRRQGLP